MRPILTASLLAIALAAAGCATKARAGEPFDETTRPAAERVEPYACGDIGRMHRMGGFLLASQPREADLALLKERGVATVVDLRHEQETPSFDERAAVESLGLAYVHLPWNGAHELTDEVFDRAREVLRTARQPVLVHCSSANRVGAVWLPWRVLDGGLDYDAALAEARAIGLSSSIYEQKARVYIERRRAKGE
jgi:uncharacterized protein (TIGR01244 family)